MYRLSIRAAFGNELPSEGYGYAPLIVKAFVILIFSLNVTSPTVYVLIDILLQAVVWDEVHFVVVSHPLYDSCVKSQLETE